MHNFCILFLSFIIYSIMGYFLEVTSILVGEKKLTLNRGFLIGPYLPIFGIGALIALYPLEKYENDLFVLFIASFLLCGILEYVTSYLMERLYGFRWWDYSKKKYNINGRICLKNLLFFGIVSVLLVKYVNPFVNNILESIDKDILFAGTMIIAVMFLLDVIVSMIIANQLKHKLVINKIMDSTKEIKAEVKKTLENSNIFIRRILRSFPDVPKILGIPKSYLRKKKSK